MSSSTTARTRPWEDKSFAHFASRCPVRLQPWFAQPNEEIDRMRLALNTGKALAPTYPKLEDADFDVLLAKVNAYEPEDQPLEPLYRLAFQHRRRLLGVAEAARVGNMDSFRRFNAALDLRADVGMYRRTLASLDARTKAHPSADAGKLIERLSLDQAWKPSFPRPDLLYTLHGPVMDLLESLGLPSMPAISEVWGGERIAAALERTLVAGSLDGKFEMKVVVSDTARSALVERSGRITIPKSYQLNGLDAYVLMARLRLSVERYYRGYLSNYYVLWNGTVDDLTAGLGILAVVEQILRGQIDRYAGEAGYLACALAEGLSGVSQSPYDIYETMRAYYRFVDTEAPKGSPVHSTPDDRAWNMVWDVFQGTDFMSPKTYLGLRTREAQGAVNMWHALARDPRIFQYATLGRFDFSSTGEVGVLTAAGVIPALR